MIIIKRILASAVLLSLLLIGYFFHVSPIAFQKAATLIPVDPGVLNSFQENIAPAPDVRNLLMAIPYRSAKAVFDILPGDRYKKTIEQGYGNCSNLTMGMAVYLLRNDYNFRVVHLLPYDSFLTGNGHTFLDMPYILDGELRHGLVDMMEAGLPMTGNVFIDMSILQRKHLKDVSIFSLNPLKDGASSYYGDFLNRAAVGIAPRSEIAHYFSFIEQLYVPLGHKRLERIIYSAIAVVLDVFPHTYVSHDEYSKLFDGKRGILGMAKLLLWLLRSIPLLIAALCISWLWHLAKAGSVQPEFDMKS